MNLEKLKVTAKTRSRSVNVRGQKNVKKPKKATATVHLYKPDIKY